MRRSFWRDGGLAIGIAALLLGSPVPPAAGAVVQEKPVLTDQTISDKIDTELTYDRAVPSYAIDVRTSDGVATLTGTVNNVLAKERAERIAETVRGVRSVVNMITVAPVSRPDAEIRADIQDVLSVNPATDAVEIDSRVADGAVTLTGTVQSWHEKQLAEKLAKGVRGVRTIDNQIAVDYLAARGDEEIRADVKSKLRWDRFVDDALIGVTVAEGTVRLGGTVGSAAEKRRARTLAWTAGVTAVDDGQLEVRYWARDDQLRTGKYVARTEGEIVGAVAAALAVDPRVNAANVDVTAAGATATLRGTVETLDARRAAGDTARNTVGVHRVKNLLKVRSTRPLTDEEVATRIRAAFARDAYVDRFDVTTAVYDGIVHLSGSVDSQYEKARAENLAASVPGVVTVRNNLSVGSVSPLPYSPYVFDWYPYEYESYGLEGPRAVNKADWVIEQDIEDELWWSPFVDADQVRVEVLDGVATLEGTVDSWAERHAATENALEGGAIRVLNRLEVRGVTS